MQPGYDETCSQRTGTAPRPGLTPLRPARSDRANASVAGHACAWRRRGSGDAQGAHRISHDARSTWASAIVTWGVRDEREHGEISGAGWVDDEIRGGDHRPVGAAVQRGAHAGAPTTTAGGCGRCGPAAAKLTTVTIPPATMPAATAIAPTSFKALRAPPRPASITGPSGESVRLRGSSVVFILRLGDPVAGFGARAQPVSGRGYPRAGVSRALGGTTAPSGESASRVNRDHRTRISAEHWLAGHLADSAQ